MRKRKQLKEKIWAGDGIGRQRKGESGARIARPLVGRTSTSVDETG